MDSVLFIVGSPFQCLCMMEAIYHFSIIEYDVLVPDKTVGSNSEKVTTLLNDKSISFSTYSIHHGVKDLLVYFLKRRKKYKNIFIGDYFNPIREAMAVYYGKCNYNLFFIDDGTQALSLFSRNPRYRYESKKGEYWFKFIVLIGRLKGCGKPSFYTIFDVHSSRFNIIRNEFSSLQTSRIISKSNCYIIGTNSSKLQFRDVTYLYLLEQTVEWLRRIWPTEKIYYCPHRGDYHNLEISAWCKHNYVEWFETRVAVEYDFVNQCIYPQTVVGFTSNALYTLKMLFPKSDIKTVMYHVCSDFADCETETIRREMNSKGIETINVL